MALIKRLDISIRFHFQLFWQPAGALLLELLASISKNRLIFNSRLVMVAMATVDTGGMKAASECSGQRCLRRLAVA